VPAWHDKVDLLASDISAELDAALNRGLSGALLVVTPDSIRSGAVRTVELPAILALANNPSFILVVGNALKVGDHLDYKAPDELLGLERGTLSNVKQMTLTSAEEATEIAGAVARLRVQRLQPSTELAIDIQTRVMPNAGAFDGLLIRLEPPEASQSLPPQDALPPFQNFLRVLPELIERSGANGITLSGGAHLSVAFCVGAAVPTTLNRTLRITDQDGGVWGDGTSDAGPDPKVIPDEFGRAGAPVAVFLDVHPERVAIDTFLTFVEAERESYSAALELRIRTRIPPSDGAGLAKKLARSVREFAASHRTEVIHLCLRTPWPLAVLLGRHFNTFEVLVHEFERPDTYRPLACVKSGAGGGPIVSIPSR
jgi:hypothetical protein